MGLNIKNERVHELARRAAARTGKTQTGVIEDALQRYLDELDDAETQQAREQRVDELLADMRKRLAGHDLSTDFLYDEETGLPA